MSGIPEASCIPWMPVAKAQHIARDLKWLVQSYAGVGMVREATRAERDSQWWLNYAIVLAHSPPEDRA